MRDQLAEIRNRRVGFVFQNFNLLPHISALESIQMPMLFGGMQFPDRRVRATELLTRVGIGDRHDHKPTELSGGQMQRVAIASALAMNPEQGRTLVNSLRMTPLLARRASRVSRSTTAASHGRDGGGVESARAFGDHRNGISHPERGCA